MSPSSWTVFLAFGDGDGAAASDDALVGIEADEGVAADFLAVFYAFEEEAFAGIPRRRGGRRRLGFRGRRSRVRKTGTRVWFLARARKSLRVGRMGWVVTGSSVTGARVQGSGFRVQGSGVRVQGSGVRGQRGRDQGTGVREQKSRDQKSRGQWTVSGGLRP